ncbi:aldo/keto reductase [Clostridium aminobutyricum]|uniref:Aldo/keto reductase n=1 Tax=Clostridium aminobutyricum TaxID=33953 RepID=A0A939D8D7_CLOAM|nr:aldo/keto reductase [Clostridium aminobutyricum]MBN7773016.1 aldo/keto reductase [Clostridium aminobutyricum]
MQYRTFPKTGEKVSLLGFGTMRFPTLENGKINEQEAIRMIRTAIDSGINYVDTAYMYHNGESEVVTGKALKDGYRKKVLLADKMPVWMARDEKGMKQIFTNQLERLDDQVIDMYLVHNITKQIWKRVLQFNTLEFLEQKRAEGKIKHIGFSFHDDFECFKEVVDAYPWDFCQIQLNYMDVNFQAGLEGLKYAAARGIPVIIMEPLKGGKLTDLLPESIEKYWAEADVKRTPAEWALRWVADFPEVLTILSGMTTMEQLQENIRILSQAEPNSLTEKEHKIIAKVSDEYNNLIKYSCTACRYCMPCPQRIEIPAVINLYNEWHLYNGNPKIKADFNMWVSPKARPSVCTSCNACQSHCPQGLPVSEIMQKAKEIFE